MNHYQILGIREEANPAEILWAYKSLQEAHASSNDIELQLEVNIAYQTLIHPARRSEYNSSLLAPISAPQQIQTIQQFHTVHHQTPVVQKTSESIDPITKAICVGIAAYSFGMLILAILLVV